MSRGIGKRVGPVVLRRRHCLQQNSLLVDPTASNRGSSRSARGPVETDMIRKVSSSWLASGRLRVRPPSSAFRHGGEYSYNYLVSELCRIICFGEVSRLPRLLFPGFFPLSLRLLVLSKKRKRKRNDHQLLNFCFLSQVLLLLLLSFLNQPVDKNGMKKLTSAGGGRMLAPRPRTTRPRSFSLSLRLSPSSSSSVQTKIAAGRRPANQQHPPPQHISRWHQGVVAVTPPRPPPSRRSAAIKPKRHERRVVVVVATLTNGERLFHVSFRPREAEERMHGEEVKLNQSIPCILQVRLVGQTEIFL